MICPLCTANLIRSQYEGLPVFSCEKCSGYLVATRRVADIEKRVIKSTAELVQEVGESAEGDNVDRLRCPRCKRHMNKDFWNRQSAFFVDRCDDCKFVWFDAGELAQVQLDHETKPHIQEAAQFQARHREMSPEERATFEKNLASLPEGDGTFTSAFREALFETLNHLIWRSRIH